MTEPDLSHIAENLRGLATPVGELHADPANARTGHDTQRIAASLKAYGQRKPLVANRAQGGKVEPGNGTLAAALSLGWTHVAVVWVDDDPATAAAFGIADNRTGELSRWDAEALGSLADVTQGLFTAFTNEELRQVLGVAPAEPTDAEPQVDRAEELRVKWQVGPGDLWRVGEHRLICGDCTDAAVVARVMGGEQVDLVVTDPPYAVDYAAKNRALQTIGRSNRLTTDIQGDTLGTEETAKAIWGPAFANAYDVSRNGAVIYCFAPQGGDQMMMMMMMLRAKWNDRLHQLIWRKNAPTFSMGRLDYSYQHEPILYSWRGTNHGFYGDGARSVIDCDRPSASKLHPTMKPVELIETLVRNSSRTGEIVYEPFSGSGTTMVACENLGRRCRAVEIAPGYVAVALERMATAFPGIVIERVAGDG